jgi:hypothetical protein
LLDEENILSFENSIDKEENSGCFELIDNNYDWFEQVKEEVLNPVQTIQNNEEINLVCESYENYNDSALKYAKFMTHSEAMDYIFKLGSYFIINNPELLLGIWELNENLNISIKNVVLICLIL